ncbi:cupin-like domain-containing protein [Ditylenchus destructor]|nr:cupin-like domain-containing protein [Ditylenchus destructor]
MAAEDKEDRFNSADAVAQANIQKLLCDLPILGALKSLASHIEQMNASDSGIHDGEELQHIKQAWDRLHWLSDGFLNVGHYGDIEEKYRLLYAVVSALGARLHYKSGNYKSALLCCDQGLLKGNDLDDGYLADLASFICREKLPPLEGLSLHSERPSTSKVSIPNPLPNSIPIPALTMPSLAVFNEEFYSKNRPVIIREMVKHWPAFQKWSFPFLNKLCGYRTVPVELGSKYTDDDWQQELMTFHDYLREYVFADSKKKGYLAQHRLPDQIPELLDDIIMPDYCAFAEGGLDEDTMTINMFIGPEGTVSPLHTDPRHNFFCQICGTKFVRLINPIWKPNLYLFEDSMRKNTSQVDVENPDLAEFPDFSQLQCEDFIMEPGDCLFIPKEYFHFVKSLDKSISVSIWFGD